MRNKAGLSLNVRSSLALTFLTQPTCTGTAGAKKFWAGRYAILRNAKRNERCYLFAWRRVLAWCRGARWHAVAWLATGKRSRALRVVKPMSTAKNFIRGLRKRTNRL